MTIFVCLVGLLVADIALTCASSIIDKKEADELKKTRASLDGYRDALHRYEESLEGYRDALYNYKDDVDKKNDALNQLWEEYDKGRETGT